MRFKVEAKKIIFIVLVTIFVLLSSEVNERFFSAIEKSKDAAIEGTTSGLLHEVVWHDNEFRDNLRAFLDGVRAGFRPGEDTAAALKERYGAKEVYFIAPDATITATATGAGAGVKLNGHFQCNDVVKGKKEYHYFGIDPQVHCERDVFGISFRAAGNTVRVTFELKKLENFFNREKLKTLIGSIVRYQSMGGAVLTGADGAVLAKHYEGDAVKTEGCIKNEYIIKLNGLPLLKMTAYSCADPLSALKKQSRAVHLIIILLFFAAYLLIEKYSRLMSSMESLKSDYSNLTEFSFRALSSFPFPAMIIEGAGRVRPVNHAGDELLRSAAVSDRPDGGGDADSAGGRMPPYAPLDQRETLFFKANPRLAEFVEISKGFSQTELLINTGGGAFRPYRCQLVRAGDMSFLLLIDAAGEKKRELQIGINSEHNMAALFLAKLAHELRNPLNAISMSLQMAKDSATATSAGGDDTVSGRIEFCLEELERLNRIIKNYIGRRPAEIEMKTVDANEALLYAISVIKNYISDGGYGERVELAAAVGRESAPVSGNADLLVQAFYNVLLNAVQAAAERSATDAGEKGVVSIEQLAEAGRIVITVTDNGGGIPAGALDKIFAIGFSTKKEGSGLGLAIVSEIMTRHGGSIEISSDGGHTSARIAIPLTGGKL